MNADRLRDLLHYDPTTGFFTWLLNRRGHACAGKRAGTVTDEGYVSIKVEGQKYLAHRLAWLYVTGQWPLTVIDHWDTDRSNNRFANLRDVSLAVNKQNTRQARKDCKSGLAGVTAHGSRFFSRIKADGKLRHLGTYDTPELAHAAYLNAKRALHPGNTL